jgi:phosphatidylinositol 3,5-bisphosphate 5-phosphatase
MIDAAAGTKNQTLQTRVSAFGILGAVRFLEGYYLVLVTKRRRVALIGQHFVYKIEDTVMLPVANGSLSPSPHPHEAKYLKIFQTVDMTSNFYFSYTYDLTNPLQCNMHAPSPEEALGQAYCADILPQPEDTYVWNTHLLQPLQGRVRPLWTVNIIHGFVAQSNLNVFGRSIYITLIARRSRHFAGTRFLKRGTNQQGWPANHVETEQIAHDASHLDHASGRYTSFVQMRASIPLFWSQDHSGMKAKPPIQLDICNPFGSQAALHFNYLFTKYESPIIILNLVKRKEKKPRESILSNEFTYVLL